MTHVWRGTTRSVGPIKRLTLATRATSRRSILLTGSDERSLDHAQRPIRGAASQAARPYPDGAAPQPRALPPVLRGAHSSSPRARAHDALDSSRRPDNRGLPPAAAHAGATRPPYRASAVEAPRSQYPLSRSVHLG